MKFAFINFGTRLTRYFVEVASRLGGDHRVAFFHFRKPKPASITRVTGHRSYSYNVVPPSRLDNEHLHCVAAKEIASGKTLDQMAKFAGQANRALDQFLDSFDPDALVLWNGSGLVASLASEKARTRGLICVYGENGYLPGTMQLDRRGVNYSASFTPNVTSDIDALLRSPGDWRELAEEYLSAYRRGRLPERTPPSRPSRPSMMARALDALLNRKAVRLPRAATQHLTEDPALPEGYVLLPLQVINDSQLIFHSPFVGQDLARLIQAVSHACREAGGIPLVVKPHPLEPRAAELASFAESHGAVVVRRAPVEQLLRSAGAVVTVNSTVGFEALLMGRSVVSVGRNFYTERGLTHTPDSLMNLADSLAAALEDVPSEERISALVHMCLTNYFARGSWQDFSEDSYRGVIQKIFSEARQAKAEKMAPTEIDADYP